MSPKKKYETITSIDVERIKKSLEESGISQRKMAELLNITPEHFYRTLKTGRIYKSWVDAIADETDTSTEYLTGQLDVPLTRFSQLRSTTDGIDHLKGFMISRGWKPDSTKFDNLTAAQLEQIEMCITFTLIEKDNLPMNKLFEQVEHRDTRIKDLEKRIKDLEKQLGKDDTE